MLDFISTDPTETTRNLIPLTAAELETWLAGQSGTIQAWIADEDYKAGRGKILKLPDEGGGPGDCLIGLGDEDRIDVWAFGDAARSLGQGMYRIARDLEAGVATRAVLGWMLGTYEFRRYLSSGSAGQFASLVAPPNADLDLVAAGYNGICLSRDLINTPANDMGPTDLASAAEKLAAEHGAEFSCIIGDELLSENYPAVHAVGRAAADAPRLIDITWGDAADPKVTLVGKGVCFDTGGLDLKAAAGMLRMKKDMGGAATVLGLTSVIMAMKLPIRLRVLIPAVENSVAGNAYRPGDILKTRKGISVEIGNTDAEGRIILCDALAEAASEKPDMIIDFATLTGAARVALGTDLPALFCNNDQMAENFLSAGLDIKDPLWRLPLYEGYRNLLDSKVADTNNISPGGFGGAITAALFLEKFVDLGVPWAHIDTYGWNDSVRPGRPAGGHPLGLMAAFQMLNEKFKS